MNYIFAGFIFAMLDITIQLESSSIGLLPGFIGYILIFIGLREMRGKSTRMDNAKKYTAVMIVYSALIYLSDAVGYSKTLLDSTYLALLPDIIATVVMLYITYSIVAGLVDIQEATGPYMEAEILLNRWKFVAALSLISYVMIISSILYAFASIATFVGVLVFLWKFWKVKNAYTNGIKKPEQ